MTDWPTFHDYPAESIIITFVLEEHGWASMDIVLNGSGIRIGSFGYCTDAMGDLVRAAVMIATGASKAEVIFDGEPMLWGLVLQDGWQSTLVPQALRFSIRSGPNQPARDQSPPIEVSSWSQVLADGYVSADAFAKAVSDAAHDVLNEYGEEGYLARWVEHSFPIRALAALDAALTAPLPSPA